MSVLHGKKLDDNHQHVLHKKCCSEQQVQGLKTREIM